MCVQYYFQATAEVRSTCEWSVSRQTVKLVSNKKKKRIWKQCRGAKQVTFKVLFGINQIFNNFWIISGISSTEWHAILFSAHICLPELPFYSPFSLVPSFWAHFYISLSPSPLHIASYTSCTFSLSPPSLYSMYCRMLMWLVKQLVKLSRLCACRSQNPSPLSTGSPLPLEPSSFFMLNNERKVGFFYNVLCPSLCIYCFLWPAIDHCYFRDLQIELNSCGWTFCGSRSHFRPKTQTW